MERATRDRARHGPHCYLIGDLHSAWQVRQDGRSATVDPGDFVLVDSRRPYEFLFDAGVHCVSLELPLHWVSYWIATPEAHVVQPFRRDRNGSWADALASLACALRPEISTSPEIAPDLIVDQLGAMLGMVSEIA